MFLQVEKEFNIIWLYVNVRSLNQLKRQNKNVQCGEKLEKEYNRADKKEYGEV